MKEAENESTGYIVLNMAHSAALEIYLILSCKAVLYLVEITNKMQPCNRIYYSKIAQAGWELQFPAQPGQRPVTTWVYRPEAANRVLSS
jgi:hypothetical protein